MLTGSVASHKVEDSEAASPNFLTRILHLWVLAPQLRAPFWPHITQRNGGTPSRPLTGLLCLHTHGVRCLPQGRRFRGCIPKLCLPQVISSPLFGYRAQLWASFYPLITQSNGGTPSRPHTGLPGLYVDRARCLPQGRRFRGRIPIPKLSLALAIFSPLLATGPNFDPPFPPLKTQSNGCSRPVSLLLSPYDSKQRGYAPFRRPRPTAAALLLTTKLSYCSTANFTKLCRQPYQFYCATALLLTSQIVSLAVPCVVSSTNCTALLRYCATANFTNFLYCATANFTAAVKLNQIVHAINIFNMKKVHPNGQKDLTKKPHVCHFCIAFKGCDFGYWPLPRFSLIPSTDLKNGFCNFMVPYVWRLVFFFAI